MLTVESGINKALIDARGYFTATKPKELLELGFSETQARSVPALVIPLHGVDASIVGHQARPDNPRMNERGKPVKYETPAAWTMRLDIHPDTRHLLDDKRTPLWITEGVKKGDAAAARGLCCIALIGVWNWRGTNEKGGSVELADWEKVAIKGRTIYIAFDSDVMVKPEVAKALKRLAGVLKRRGAAQVLPVVPPVRAGQKKAGLDDFFVAGGVVNELIHAVDADLLSEREVVVNNRSLADMAQDAMDALIDANIPPTVFVRSGELVRIVTDERDLTKIEQLDERGVRHVLARCATWVRKTKDGGTEVAPPLDIVADVLAMRRWPQLPPIVAVTKAPVLAPDGTLSTTPGYCPRSLFYVAAKESWPEWSGTTEDAVEFLRNEVLADFPFSSEACFAHSLALMLLPIVRPVIDGPTPLHLIDAPVQGTGKSLLAKVCLMPTAGGEISAATAAKDEEEWRKRITSLLLEGRTYIFLDNLSRKVDSEALAAALTTTEWADRALQQTRIVTVPVRCAWVATANNAELSRDILRRSVWIRLDAKVERPEDRQGFKHPDIEQWVRDNKQQIVSALCHMVREWVAQDRPLFTDVHIGSYERWAKVIGGILKACGVPGFLSNIEQLRKQGSTDDVAWVGFCYRWFLHFGSQPVKASQLREEFEIDEELAGTLGDKGDSSKTTRLGFLLKRRVGVIYGGYRIERAECPGDHSWRYKLVETQPNPHRNGKPSLQPSLTDADSKEGEIMRVNEGYEGFSSPRGYTHIHARETAPEMSGKPSNAHNPHEVIDEVEI